MVLKVLTAKQLPNKAYVLYFRDEVDNIHSNGVAVDDGNYDNGTFKDRDYDVRTYKEIAINLENIGANAVKYKVQSTTKHYDDLDADLTDDDFDKEEKSETEIAAGSKATGSVEVTGGPSVKASGTLTLSSAVAETKATGTVTCASVAAETKATGTITCASVEAGDTVTVNGLVYTAVSGTKADNTEFDISGTDTQAATDLADSITNDTRNGTLGDVTATSSGDVVTATSDETGTSGNSVTLTSSNGTRLAVSGSGTFTGGVDPDTVTINGLVYTAVSGTKADNTEFDVSGTDDAAATDLADSITNDGRSGTLGDVTATASTNVVTCTSDEEGADGNAVTLVSSNGTRLAVSGSGTFTGGVTADKATVNGLVYTAVAGTKNDNTEFSIDTSDTAAATDLADSITNDARTPVTVSTIDVTATSSGAVVTVDAPVNDGADGNAIDIAGTTNITASAANLENGVTSSISSITVGGLEILGATVRWRDNVTNTASDIKDQINAFTSNPNYSATNSAGVITITANDNEASTATVASTTSTMTTTDSNMSGGASGKSDLVKILRDSPSITAIRLRAKESAAGSPGKIRANIKAL